MKILFTGGGSGGHFYPIIAGADAIYENIQEKKLIKTQLILTDTSNYDN